MQTVAELLVDPPLGYLWPPSHCLLVCWPAGLLTGIVAESYAGRAYTTTGSLDCTER